MFTGFATSVNRNDQLSIVLTGAMGGLGTAICTALAHSGLTVVANCLPNFAPKDERISKMRMQGFDFAVAAADVSDHEACQAMVGRIDAEHGPGDVLVNNAGITRDSVFKKMHTEQWDAVMATNLDSLFNVTYPILAGLADRVWGRVINISSVNGVKGQFWQANCAAAKAGVLGFTKSIAAEVAEKGITVNAIAPGYIATEIVLAMKQETRDSKVATVLMGRLGRPEEIGALCAYLVSNFGGLHDRSEARATSPALSMRNRPTSMVSGPTTARRELQPPKNGSRAPVGTKALGGPIGRAGLSHSIVKRCRPVTRSKASSNRSKTPLVLSSSFAWTRQ
jgi:acetoacetyl-CoA reductase